MKNAERNIFIAVIKLKKTFSFLQDNVQNLIESGADPTEFVQDQKAEMQNIQTLLDEYKDAINELETLLND